jgi:HSP20 family protein
MAGTITPSSPSVQRSLATAASSDPFSLLRKEIDDLFSNFWGHQRTPLTTSFSPALDVSESENAYFVKMDAPGFESKELKVQVQGNTITLSGEHKEEKESKDKTYHRIERRSGSFSRTVTLPANVNEDEVAAEYTNGVLAVTLPKSEKAKLKSVSIKS